MQDEFPNPGVMRPKKGVKEQIEATYGDILKDVSDIFPARVVAESGEPRIYLPDYVFPPDGWTKVFQAGLEAYGSTYSFDGKNVAEIGVGSGINALYLLQAHKPAKVYGSDINDKTAMAAALNVMLNLPPEKADIYRAVLGDWNLADWMPTRGSVNVFIGCLPQAPLPKGVDIKAGNHFGDYYDPTLFEDGERPELKEYAHRMNELGLGLNNSALATFNKKLEVGAHVILNFGGRPGIDNLKQMFEANGFSMTILNGNGEGTVVEQDPKTDIIPFVEREKELQETDPGFSFEFFADQGGAQRITAAEAQQLRDIEKKNIYHKIYVLMGEKESELE